MADQPKASIYKRQDKYMNKRSYTLRGIRNYDHRVRATDNTVTVMDVALGGRKTAP
jgi:hypothetical protein